MLTQNVVETLHTSDNCRRSILTFFFFFAAIRAEKCVQCQSFFEQKKKMTKSGYLNFIREPELVRNGKIGKHVHTYSIIMKTCRQFHLLMFVFSRQNER